MLWGKGWPEVARGTGRVGVRARAAAHAGRAGAHPPRRSMVLPPAQGPRCARPRAHAPGTQRPALLRVRRARAHRSPRLRAARDIHRARLLPWQARDGRDRKRPGGCGGPGVHARASQAGWCLCAASVRRVHVYCHVNSLTHTQTHTNTQARAAENALELAGLGLSPPSLHSGQVRRARARRTAAQLQASCPPSAGQEPSPPLEQKAPAV